MHIDVSMASGRPEMAAHALFVCGLGAPTSALPGEEIIAWIEATCVSRKGR